MAHSLSRAIAAARQQLVRGGMEGETRRLVGHVGQQLTVLGLPDEQAFVRRPRRDQGSIGR